MEHPVTWTGLIGIPHGDWEYFAIGMLIMGILLLLGVRARGELAKDSAVVPDEGLSARNVFELLVEAIGGLCDSVIGHGAAKYVPLLSTFFIFILFCNFMGLLPGFTPPTSDFDITLALGVVSFVAFNYYGFKAQGVAYLKHFMGPILWLAPLMIVLELVGTLVRPVSLGLRLFGNLFGDHLVLEIFTGLTKVGIPVVFYLLGTLVAVIQAFVFTLLSMIYIALAVAHHDAEHAEHAH
ncbi:MAG: F0F1 ATP synthase subunit A [Deltaproteobacteria bacterium]|nr:F0F1 ATP synthase subunit A [Deltaproteobacteria bacterium]